MRGGRPTVAVPVRTGKATDDLLARLAKEMDAAESEMKKEYNTRSNTRTGTLSRRDEETLKYLSAEFDVSGNAKEKIDVAPDFELNLDFDFSGSTATGFKSPSQTKNDGLDLDQLSELDSLVAEIDFGLDF